MKARSSALIMVPSLIINSYRHEIVSFAAKHRLPAIYAVNRYVISGGLMSYGPSIAALSHRGAYFADKILKGTKPADYLWSSRQSCMVLSPSPRDLTRKINREFARRWKEVFITKCRADSVVHPAHFISV